MLTLRKRDFKALKFINDEDNFENETADNKNFLCHAQPNFKDLSDTKYSPKNTKINTGLTAINSMSEFVKSSWKSMAVNFMTLLCWKRRKLYNQVCKITKFLSNGKVMLKLYLDSNNKLDKLNHAKRQKALKSMDDINELKMKLLQLSSESDENSSESEHKNNDQEDILEQLKKSWDLLVDQMKFVSTMQIDPENLPVLRSLSNRIK